MVGQRRILSDISELVDNDKYPRFSIFVGKNSSFTINVTNDKATGYLSDTVANVDATRCTLVTYTEKATETLTSGSPTKREDAVTSDFTVVTGAVSDFVTANK